MKNLAFLSILIFLITNSLIAFCQNDKKDILFDWVNYPEQLTETIDTSLKMFTPTIKEIISAKALSNKYINSLEKSKLKTKTDLKEKIMKFDPMNYYRQVFGYIAKNGHRIIYINAFCQAPENINRLEKNWLVTICESECCIRIQVDLTDKRCFGCSFN
jgi:hypothetical protein